MPLFIGDARVSRKNFFNRSSLVSLASAWTQLQPLLLNPSLELSAKIVLAKWRGDTTSDNLASVWSNASWTKWMKKTHSGELFLNPVAIHVE